VELYLQRGAQLKEAQAQLYLYITKYKAYLKFAALHIKRKTAREKTSQNNLK
jgi:hypothetical protein